jgi:serine/threonine-protein kinase RsbW
LTVLTPWPGVPDEGGGASAGTRPDANGTPQGPQESPDLEIVLPAEPRQLFMVRSVVGGIAAGEDYEPEDTADVRMAADEMASVLLLLAAPGSKLRCMFTVADDGALTMGAEVPVEAGAAVDTSAFGWHVLTTVADSARTWSTPHPRKPGTEMLHVEVTKRPGRRRAPGEHTGDHDRAGRPE